jgi:hypothetical protein
MISFLFLFLFFQGMKWQALAYPKGQPLRVPLTLSRNISSQGLNGCDENVSNVHLKDEKRTLAKLRREELQLC